MDSYTYITYINEASIIPQNFNWRPELSPGEIKQNQQIACDPGAAMAQAFLQGLSSKKPSYNPPPIQKSKQDLYWQDVMGCGAPIPSFGVQDTRPETHNDLVAQQNPVQINEVPDKEVGVANNYQLSNTGMSVIDYSFKEMPVNGLPNISM